MNERFKKKMLQQKTTIVEGLEGNFSNIPLFEDEIAEDEEESFFNSKYHALVLVMGDFTPKGNPGTLTQSIFIDYYSESRDDVDETLLDIITIIDKVPTMDFLKTSKVRMRAADTDRFVDVITLEFRRTVKYEC